MNTDYHTISQMCYKCLNRRKKKKNSRKLYKYTRFVKIRDNSGKLIKLTSETPLNIILNLENKVKLLEEQIQDKNNYIKTLEAKLT